MNFIRQLKWENVLIKIYKGYYQCGCYSDDLLLNWSTDALILELIKFKDILICRTIK
jgi:hypothetical protein